MLLIIPAIDLIEEHCVRRTKDAYRREEEFFDDPVKMAKLWRIQNARSLHIAGHDRGESCERSVLEAVCNAVDIPVQLQGGFQTQRDVESALSAGVYRVVVDGDDNIAGF